MEGMKEYPDGHFDLAMVDPPYGIERFKICKENNNNKTKDVYANKFLNNEKFNNKKPDPEYFNQLFRVSKNQIIWGANNFKLPPSEYFLIWDKHQTMPNFARCEYAWVSMGLKKPAKIFEFGIHKHNKTIKIHPTQKPIALYLWLLNNYAKQGDLILDTHVGSASSLVACEKLGFNYVGYELDKDYYKAACDRLNEFRQQIDMFIDKPVPMIEQERLNL